MESYTVEKVKEMLRDIMTNCFEKAQESRKAEGYIKLERGFAIIPLPGIDVPFHSCYLWAGVMPFPACKLRRTVMITFHSIRFQTFNAKYEPRAD
jgi:hypothetical protein